MRSIYVLSVIIKEQFVSVDVSLSRVGSKSLPTNLLIMIAKVFGLDEKA